MIRVYILRDFYFIATTIYCGSEMKMFEVIGMIPDEFNRLPIMMYVQIFVNSNILLDFPNSSFSVLFRKSQFALGFLT